MNWMNTMRLSVMAVLASAMMMGCSSDPEVEDPADTGHADVMPDEDAADADDVNRQDTCLAAPVCDEGYVTHDSCEGQADCEEVSRCGATIFCVLEEGCDEVPMCEADEVEVEIQDCAGYQECRSVQACGDVVYCVSQDETCNPDMGCGETRQQVDTCEGLGACFESEVCDVTIYCASGDVCEEEPVCPAETVEVDSCDGVENCQDVTTCGQIIHCAP